MKQDKPTFELTPWNRGISDEELLVDLKRVAAEQGSQTVAYDEYDRVGKCRSRTVEVRFGGWNKALERAGLTVTRRRDRTDEELLENLEQVWTKLGRQPRRQELRPPLSTASGGTYERRFGGWRHALEKFVEWVNSEPIDSASSANSTSELNRSASEPRFPSLRLKFIVMRRDRFSCCHCGKSPARDLGVILHVDHIKPWSQNGKTTLDNLQTLCESCNLGKSNLEEK